MELLYCEVKSKTRLDSVTVYVDRLFLNSILQWWDQWVGKGSQKLQGCNWVVVCPLIMQAASPALASPQKPPRSSAPLMLVTKHTATCYMTSYIILTLLLCGMNISPFLWREKAYLMPSKKKKYIAASVVKISSWQVTRIYRREKNSLKLSPCGVGFFFTSNSFYFNF